MAINTIYIFRNVYIIKKNVHAFDLHFMNLIAQLGDEDARQFCIARKLLTV